MKKIQKILCYSLLIATCATMVSTSAAIEYVKCAIIVTNKMPFKHFSFDRLGVEGTVANLFIPRCNEHISYKGDSLYKEVCGQSNAFNILYVRPQYTNCKEIKGKVMLYFPSKGSEPKVIESKESLENMTYTIPDPKKYGKLRIYNIEYPKDFSRLRADEEKINSRMSGSAAKNVSLARNPPIIPPKKAPLAYKAKSVTPTHLQR